MDAFIAGVKNGFEPDPEENIFASVWKQYERVIIESLVVSFGLDFIKDQVGGDVDTVHNVRNLKDSDGNIIYKNKNNELDYKNREKYDTNAYHKDSRYSSIVRKAKKEFVESGKKMDDAYVPGNKIVPYRNKNIPLGQQAQLDHVQSAEEIHNDPGRILAGIDGKELANNPDNLRFTNAALNNNMKEKSIDEYIEWCEKNPDQVKWGGKEGEPLPDEVKEQLIKEYNEAKKKNDEKINRAYYTSKKFIKDAGVAAAKKSAQMGVRQALGFVFMEIWFTCKEELQALPNDKSMGDMFNAVGEGIRKGFKNARLKYKELIQKVEEGATAGVLSSLTTTLCNIFFTTAKNLGKVIRNLYASIVQAGNVLLFNPNNLLFGDRIKTASVIMATGASVLLGTLVSETINQTPVGKIPVVGAIVCSFAASLVSGLTSCTLLVFLDKSKFMNDVIDAMNKIPTEVNNYKEIADQMEKLAANLANIDYEKFKREASEYQKFTDSIIKSKDDNELNGVLLAAYKEFDIKIPWEGDFDSFMGNKNNRLVFE